MDVVHILSNFAADCTADDPLISRFFNCSKFKTFYSVFFHVQKPVHIFLVSTAYDIHSTGRERCRTSSLVSSVCLSFSIIPLNSRHPGICF